MNFDQIVTAFYNGEIRAISNGGANLKIVDNQILHFNTVILERYGSDYVFNVTIYSKQTTFLQHKIRLLIPQNKLTFIDNVPKGYSRSLIELIHP